MRHSALGKVTVGDVQSSMSRETMGFVHSSLDFGVLVTLLNSNGAMANNFTTLKTAIVIQPNETPTSQDSEFSAFRVLGLFMLVSYMLGPYYPYASKRSSGTHIGQE